MAADHAFLATFNKLGLNQSRLAKRRGRLRLICYLGTFVVAWTLADLAGRNPTQKVRPVEVAGCHSRRHC
jgi:hypothetical protein